MNQIETKFEDIPTPRTDKLVNSYYCECNEGTVVNKSDVEQLECELHVAKESLKSLKDIGRSLVSRLELDNEIMRETGYPTSVKLNRQRIDTFNTIVLAIDKAMQLKGK